jgi:hypothetical protein
MDSIEQSLLIIICIDILLVAGQFAVTGINPDSTLSFIHLNSTLVGSDDWNIGNSTTPVLNQNASSDFLPSSINPVNADTGGTTFTDTISTIKNWIVTIPKILISLLFAPIVYLSALGIPSAFTYLLGAGWFLFNLFIIIKFITGR